MHKFGLFDFTITAPEKGQVSHFVTRCFYKEAGRIDYCSQSSKNGEIMFISRS